MSDFEPKKMALLRIFQILKENSDEKHPMTQEEIARLLEKDYGIVLERKAISRNISRLQEAGIEVDSCRNGCYLHARDFEDSELRMLIDGVLSSRYITAKHSKDLIRKLSALSNKYFKSHIKNVYSVNDWNKTDNQALFFNIDLIDEAIEKGLMVSYDYNMYGIDKKLHKTSYQRVSPYQLILHNQRYYLMAYSDYWKHMVFHRLDHITNMQVREDKPAIDIRTVPGYQSGINYKELSSSKPYMFADPPEHITFLADNAVIDQIIDWFGKDVRFVKIDENTVEVHVNASLNAMEHWALQYLKYVEVTGPEALRERIKKTLIEGKEKYTS